MLLPLLKLKCALSCGTNNCWLSLPSPVATGMADYWRQRIGGGAAIKPPANLAPRSMIERLRALKKIRSDKAQAYFSRNASEWDELRRLHVNDADVEAALLQIVGTEAVESMLDLGTGTGRILQLLSPRYRRAIGIDASRDMLAVARSNLDKAGILSATVRHGDILNLPLDAADFDLVTILQLRAQGREVTVNSGGHAPVTNIGVHGIGKIDCGSANWQLDDFTFR